MNLAALAMTDLPRPIPESYWVIPGRFLAGKYPGGFERDQVRLRIGKLLEAGLDTFINLTHPNELPSYEATLEEQARLGQKDARHLRFSVTDFGLPSHAGMRATLDAPDTALNEGRNIYLHCWAGVGRTGTVVGCYLVRHGVSGQQALVQLAAWWKTDPRRDRFKRSPETDEQTQFILNWHELA
ncbi:MAG: hypothetical protein HFACDABA_02849 [Anaerolineales bacterium]|nr:hypothetical protein [Anaerolineales bacterium]